jgi:hypothetical protein
LAVVFRFRVPFSRGKAVPAMNSGRIARLFAIQSRPAWNYFNYLAIPGSPFYVAVQLREKNREIKRQGPGGGQPVVIELNLKELMVQLPA